MKAGSDSKRMTPGSVIFLSFPLNADTPAYGDGSRLSVRAVNRIHNGDSCNTSEWTIPNHLGTHIDAPRHFDAEGMTIDQYAPEFWVCDRIGLADVSPIQPGELISTQQIPFDELHRDIDMLLIKTDFTRYRRQDIYWSTNPGLEPDLADELRRAFPDLKLIGYDAISLSSFANRDVGRLAHRAFLANARPLPVIEDMNLSGVQSDTVVKRIWVAPLIVDGADGAPCTVLAEVIGS